MRFMSRRLPSLWRDPSGRQPTCRHIPAALRSPGRNANPQRAHPSSSAFRINPMTDALREKLINAGRVLVDEGQGDYVWGHISVRLPDNPNRFLMKPGCIGIEEMTQDNIITVDIEGERISGTWPRH